MRTLLTVLVALTVAGCRDTIIIPIAPSPTAAPTPTLTRTVFEFRATGNASSARIRYSTPADGLTQVVSSLPYANSFVATDTSLFLSLEVTPLAYSVISNPFLSISIVAGGAVFRQATQNDLTANTLAVSGTWRQ